MSFLSLKIMEGAVGVLLRSRMEAVRQSRYNRDTGGSGDQGAWFTEADRRQNAELSN